MSLTKPFCLLTKGVESLLVRFADTRLALTATDLDLERSSQLWCDALLLGQTVAYSLLVLIHSELHGAGIDVL